MLVTGILHCVIGLVIVITAIIQFRVQTVRNMYGYGAAVSSIWIFVTGGLGIAAGIKRLQDEKVRQLKIAYMVLSIWSVINFAGLILVYTMIGEVLTPSDLLNIIEFERRVTLFRIQLAFTGIEIILGIISFSICCCCSPTPRPACPGVILQLPPEQVLATAQGYGTPLQQLPTNTSITNETLQNGTMGYKPPHYTPNPIPPNPSGVHILTETPTEPNPVTIAAYTNPNFDPTQPQ